MKAKKIVLRAMERMLELEIKKKNCWQMSIDFAGP